MEPKVRIKRLGFIEKALDLLFVPLMYVVSGTLVESPQKTHRWNNRRLSREETSDLLENASLLTLSGDRSAKSKGWLRFHMPIFGGWRTYAVLRPKDFRGGWHIGWLTGKTAGISRIVITGPLRVLLGPNDTSFFGITTDGDPIEIERVAIGQIGSRGEHSQTPLL